MKKPPFPELFCQCRQMSVKGGNADALTKQWVAMDFKDHHLGRPCGTGLVTL